MCTLMTSDAKIVYTIKTWMMDFANLTIEKFSIDNSHGMEHFIDAVDQVTKILSAVNMQIITGYSKQAENELILDAAFLHDTIDLKYVTPIWLDRLIAELRNHNYSDDSIDGIVFIITNMSFSKRYARLNQGLSMIPESKWTLATGIVADGDQLCGYKYERCIEYQTRHAKTNPDYVGLSDDKYQHKLNSRIKTVLCLRVLCYIEKYMTTSVARKIAEPLHCELKKYVDFNLASADILEY